MLKEYFANLGLHDSDVTFDLGSGEVNYHQEAQLPWRVTVADTGLEHDDGRARAARAGSISTPVRAFCLTYGDGVGDVDVAATIEMHRRTGCSRR